MRSSAVSLPRNAPTDKTAGFTLIEMLSVLVIISLMTGIVVLSMPREKPVIEQHSNMMARQFAVAAQTSMISGQSQGFGLSQDAYYFYRFEEGSWEILSETQWPEDINIKLAREDVNLDIPKKAVPVVVFEPMGLSTVFSLSLEDSNQTITFYSEGDGKVLMESPL